MLVGGSCSTEKLVFHFSDSKRLWSEKHPVLTFRLGKIFSTVREVGCLVDVVVVVVVDVECRHRGCRRCRCRCTMLLLSPVPSVAVEVWTCYGRKRTKNVFVGLKKNLFFSSDAFETLVVIVRTPCPWLSDVSKVRVFQDNNQWLSNQPKMTFSCLFQLVLDFMRNNLRLDSDTQTLNDWNNYDYSEIEVTTIIQIVSQIMSAPNCCHIGQMSQIWKNDKVLVPVLNPGPGTRESLTAPANTVFNKISCPYKNWPKTSP